MKVLALAGSSVAGGQNDTQFWVFLFGCIFAKGDRIRIGQDSVLTESVKHAITQHSCYEISCYQHNWSDSKFQGS